MTQVSSREVVHLVASMVVLTIAFTYPSLNPVTLAIVAFSVGVAFIFHELAHKFTAQRYGYFADFEASSTGLLMALGLSIMTNGSFVFAAPGAVMIRGKKVFYSSIEDYHMDSRKTEKELAYVSVSGAVTNLILAISFLVISYLMPPLSIEYMVLRTGAFINVFLAGFNMIPFGPLDGAKVWRYNRALWAIVMVPSVVLFLII